MSDTSFVAKELVTERAAPVRSTGFVGFVQTRLLNSPTNILLTVVSLLLLWFTIAPTVKFLLIDAVWQGQDRTACLPENTWPRRWRLLAVRAGQVHAVYLRLLS
jgi:general L-amino acid transport system permease protein